MAMQGYLKDLHQVCVILVTKIIFKHINTYKKKASDNLVHLLICRAPGRAYKLDEKVKDPKVVRKKTCVQMHANVPKIVRIAK